MLKLNQIYNMDCIEGMKQIEDNSVDCVFTDPPYNQKKDYGVYNDNVPWDKYDKFNEKWLKECNRISKQIIVFISSNLINRFWNYKILKKSNLLIVHKKAYGIEKNNVVNQYFGILFTENPKKKIQNLWNDIKLPGEGYIFRENKYYDNPGFTSLLLTRKIIDSFSNENDVVCDPFSGVGTTAVACKQLKRYYIGWEINEKYCEIAQKRLYNVPLRLEEFIT